ncbi:hypothetical protein J6590_061527 [Homalodisca vitripennis]|nr:hypothetical protein J6590_061527 [Homalodisca vitripennis]
MILVIIDKQWPKTEAKVAETDLASIRWACLPVTGAFPNAPGAALDYCLNLKNKYKLIQIHKNRTHCLLHQNSTMSSATGLYSVIDAMRNNALQTLPSRVGTCHVASGPVPCITNART